ncbi:MAG: phosphate ABC transporter substrate-binding protein [Caldilinea sp. CFX5]|nr:phosphate ABC transporter substrate-binding protein [Caldilinea sp. CFX5]
MERLRMTTCMAPGMDGFCRQLTDYVASRLGRAIEFVIDLDWTERYRQLDAGAIQIAWICGAPYVVRRPQGQVALLAAPVWRGEHYGDQPVYYSDMMVRRDHPAQHFGALRGQRWAYNEPGSLSGYHVMRAHLARLGEGLAFFSQAIEAGYHRRALQMLVAGEADVAAIDTTVFEQITQEQPALIGAVRALGRLGPNPAPPWVIRTEVPLALRQAITAIFSTMAAEQTGAALLAASPVARFARVADTDYDPAQTMVTLSAALG